MKGKIVASAPPRSARTGSSVYDWDSMAKQALEHPDKAVLAAKDVPITRITALRMYKRYPFLDENGNRLVKILMRNSTEKFDKERNRTIRFGDVYFEAA